MLRHVTFLALSAFLLRTASPQAALLSPFSGLNAAERAQLEKGERVARVSEDADSLLIAPSAPGSAAAAAAVRKLKPNYVVELVATMRAGDRDVAGIIADTLTSPEAWVGIPYWSERNKKTYDLFDKCVVKKREKRSDGSYLEVLHHMKPFDDYSSRYEYRRSGDGIEYNGENSSPLVYKGVKAVAPGQMLWRILVWRAGDTWFFYGVGAVKAFDMFGAARSRLEPSFIGRTRSFFEFVWDRLAGSAS